MGNMSATTNSPSTNPSESPKINKTNSINHSRPYTFESRRGPHYYPHRVSSPPLPGSGTSGGTTTPTSTTTHTATGVKSSSASTTSSTRTRSPPLHPDEIFQPPSLCEKKSQKHMYNSAAAVTTPPTAYADPYLYNYNPAVEPQPFGWNDEGGLVDFSQPGYIDLVENRQRRILSRSRLFLRVLITLSTIAMVAGLGSAIAVYFDTREDGLFFNNEPIWHPNLDMKPSNILLGIGGGLAVISSAMLVLSCWAKIRQVSLVSNLINLAISILNIVLAIFAGAYFVYYKGAAEAPTFWYWVCDQGVEEDTVQFGMLCGETRFSYAMAYVITVLEVLVMVNIVVGWVMLGKNGGRSRGIGRTVVVQVKKAEKKQGQWKESY